MTDTSRFSLRTDVALIPAGLPATRYVLLSLTAPEGRRDTSRPSINVSFVLDRSGSMAGGKIGLAREAVKQARAICRKKPSKPEGAMTSMISEGVSPAFQNVCHW